MNQTLKGAIWTFAFCIATELLYKMLKRKSSNEKRAASSKVANSSFLTQGPENNRESDTCQSEAPVKVLFFPDKKVACHEHFIGDGCFKDSCHFSHEETSLSQLFHYLMTTKQTLDVCLFLITCKDLADILLKLHRRGVKIRIVTDSEQLNCDGSQIWALRKAGVPVRTHKSSYLMHHKFVVQDNKVLLNGSFNWTRQAITGNHENLIISNDPSITSLFIKQFQRLWMDFDPNG